MSELQAIVIVQFDEDGDITYHVCGGEAVRLFIVDERTPSDRIFEWLQRCDAGTIRQIVPEGETIGSGQDERHAAIAHTVQAYLDGRPHLSVVDTPDAQ